MKSRRQLVVVVTMSALSSILVATAVLSGGCVGQNGGGTAPGVVQTLQVFSTFTNCPAAVDGVLGSIELKTTIKGQPQQLGCTLPEYGCGNPGDSSTIDVTETAVPGTPYVTFNTTVSGKICNTVPTTGGNPQGVVLPPGSICSDYSWGYDASLYPASPQLTFAPQAGIDGVAAFVPGDLNSIDWSASEDSAVAYVTFDCSKQITPGN